MDIDPIESAEVAIGVMNRYIVDRAAELRTGRLEVSNQGYAGTVPVDSNNALDVLQARLNRIRKDVYGTTIAAQRDARLTRRTGQSEF